MFHSSYLPLFPIGADDIIVLPLLTGLLHQHPSCASQGDKFWVTIFNVFVALNATFSSLKGSTPQNLTDFTSVPAGHTKDIASSHTPFPKQGSGTDLPWKRLEDALLRSFSDLFCAMLWIMCIT